MIIEDADAFIPKLDEAVKQLGIDTIKLPRFYQVWWRGQPDYNSPLTASVYRSEDYNQNSEARANMAFMLEAPVRYENCPTQKIHWLLLMQHYGMRTRLLDWSRSPLVALYFAVSDEDCKNKPAALFALAPVMLNISKVNSNAILSTASTEVIKMANAAFTSGQENEDIAIAIYPPCRDIRMLVQQSMCTIHGSPTPIDRPDNFYFQKIKIPADQKPRLREILHNSFVIRESTLFPDLQHLGHDTSSSLLPL